MIADAAGGALSGTPLIPPLPALPTVPVTLPLVTVPPVTVPPLPVPLPTPPVPAPTVPTVPVSPTVPVTTPTVSPTVPTVPGGATVPAPGPSSPPPGTGGSPPDPSGTSPGTTAAPPGTTDPTSPSSTVPEECPAPSTSSPPETTDPADPAESSVPSSEPVESTEPDDVEPATTICEEGSVGSAQSLPGQVADGDLTIAAVLASVEVLAVKAYTTAIGAADAGDFGELPPALAQYLATAVGHHDAGLQAWNGVLLAAARPAVTLAPVNPATSINVQLRSVGDAVGAARVVLSLETLVAATYLDALGKLASEPAVRLAGSVLPIGRQRMSALLFALGEYPVPESFATTEFAFVP